VPADQGHAQLFFSIYFAMTGLHALHMVIGVGILLTLIVQAQKGKFSASYYTRSMWRDSTGTSSTSSGFSCSRCSI